MISFSLTEEPCKTDAPSECCVWFGKVADYLVERDYAKRYTKEELYKLMKRCEEAGLVISRRIERSPTTSSCAIAANAAVST